MSNEINALAALVGRSWNHNDDYSDRYGDPLDITFSFSGVQMPYWLPVELFKKNIISGTFSDLSPTQKEVFRVAAALWEGVANVHLTEETPYTTTLPNGMSVALGDIVISHVGRARLFAPDIPAGSMSASYGREMSGNDKAVARPTRLHCIAGKDGFRPPCLYPSYGDYDLQRTPSRIKANQ